MMYRRARVLVKYINERNLRLNFNLMAHTKVKNLNLIDKCEDLSLNPNTYIKNQVRRMTCGMILIDTGFRLTINSNSYNTTHNGPSKLMETWSTLNQYIPLSLLLSLLCFKSLKQHIINVHKYSKF